VILQSHQQQRRSEKRISRSWLLKPAKFLCKQYRNDIYDGSWARIHQVHGTKQTFYVIHLVAALMEWLYGGCEMSRVCCARCKRC
jgi:hypothetical protein